jgi:sialic acid synthase SpsE
MKINGRKIGFGMPCYIIAEVSANHEQKWDRAVALIYAAKKAGADAVKLQTYTPDTLVNRDNPLYELYSRAYMPWEWQPKLKKLADDIGFTLFSSVYDKSSVDFLDSMDVPAYKVSSFEITDLELIRYVASKRRPMFVSPGMATMLEIRRVREVTEAWQLGLLKCTSAYPASAQDMNLGAMKELMDKFFVPVGLSNHCQERAVPVAAVAMGASIVEQHITLSRDAIDGAFSLLPDEFAAMVHDIRVTEQAMGDHVGLTDGEKQNYGVRRDPSTGKRGTCAVTQG